MSETTVSPATTDATDATPETEDESMTLDQASAILSGNPLYAGMWGFTAPSVARLTELSETLRKVSVSDADVREAIKGSEVKSVVSKRDEIAKLREQAAKIESELFETVKAALKGDEMSPEDEKAARDEFKAEKDKVVSFADSWMKIAFSGGDDGSDEFAALETLKSATPTLRGTGVKFGQKMNGAENATHIREWVKANRTDISMSERGRLGGDALSAHFQGCEDCRNKRNGAKK